MTSRGILDFQTIFGRRPLAFFFFSEPLTFLPSSIVALPAGKLSLLMTNERKQASVDLVERIRARVVVFVGGHGGTVL
jgi:hypothetical protein